LRNSELLSCSRSWSCWLWWFVVSKVRAQHNLTTLSNNSFGWLDYFAHAERSKCCHMIDKKKSGHMLLVLLVCSSELSYSFGSVQKLVYNCNYYSAQVL
jgi:hypothetical protein